MQATNIFHKTGPTPSERKAWMNWKTASKTMSQPSKRATPIDEAVGSHSASRPTTIMITGQTIDGLTGEGWRVLLSMFISSSNARGFSSFDKRSLRRYPGRSAIRDDRYIYHQRFSTHLPTMTAFA